MGWRWLAAALLAAASLAVAVLGGVTGFSDPEFGPGPALGSSPETYSISEAAASYSTQELEIVRLINEYRESLGLQPLMISDRCSKAAERHSSDMAKYNFFSHTTQASDWFPVGADARVRLAMCGYGYPIAWGENIAAGQAQAATVVSAWKQSPPHNAILTAPEYRVVGVGRVYNPDSQYGYYWTADFGAYVDDSAYWPEGWGPSSTSSSPTSSTSTTASTTTTTELSATTTTAPSPTTTTAPPTTTTTALRQIFADVPPSHRFFEPITALAQAGVVSGYSDQRFHPDDYLTRAQFAKIIVLALGKHTPEIDNPDAPTFSDVPYTGSAYPFDYIEEATALGIIKGRGDGTFGPGDNITRLQVVLMLVRAGAGILETPPPGQLCPFADVPDYGRDAVIIAFYNNLVSGKTTTSFGSYSPATRGQAAKMVYGLVQRIPR